MRTETGMTIRLEDYQPPKFRIPETHLTFRLGPDETLVTARLDIEPQKDDASLVLDGDGLSLKAIRLDGASLEANQYDVSENKLEVFSVPGVPFQLELETAIAPSQNKALMGLYRSNNVYCTQCEAEGFRRITYFLDRPDVLSIYRVRIEAEKAPNPLLLSNGNLVQSGPLENGWHFADWHDPHPKPSYLFALVAGDLDVLSDRFETLSGRDVELNIYVEKGKAPMAAYAMDALKRSMAWDEKIYGREYDLDLFNIVAVSDFNMGAMENKGLNVFNDKYVLADPETATDTDYSHIEAIIAHEYFHNWTGNRITCRDWFQLCLKEGLTVYRDHEFSADERSRAVKRIQEIKVLKAQQFPEDQGPLAHPVRPRQYKEINNFYTATVYEKGSEVVRMLRTLLGDTVFYQSLDLYFDRHDGDAATIEQFLACFAETSGRDLSQFSLWYEQAGTPNLTISEQYDCDAQTHKITIEQAQAPTAGMASKKPLHMPISFALLGKDGVHLPHGNVEGATIRDDVIELTESRHEIIFSDVAQKPVASLLRGFSAPVTVSRDLSSEALSFLGQYETDPVNRWMAINHIYLDALKKASREARNGAPEPLANSVIEMVQSVLEETRFDPAFIALCLTLPSEGDIAREIGSNIDPDAIHRARKAMEVSLSTQLHDVIAQRRADVELPAQFSPDAESAGKRSLHNRLLEMEAIGHNDPQMLAHAIETADNMTDRMQRLGALVLGFPKAHESEKALSAFRKDYDGNALVLDKWLMLVASIPGNDALERIKQTMNDPAFDADNPNRVRSLIGSFAAANPTGFHTPDGKAYDFFAGQLLAIDQRNPQLSARLLTLLRAWASLEPKRKTKMREALSTIAKGPNLSRDLQEIVDRMIG